MVNDTFKFDPRVREIQTRQVREGNCMIFQGRTVIHNTDGTKEYPDWRTTGCIPNYGDVFDRKLSKFQKLKNWLTRQGEVMFFIVFYKEGVKFKSDPMKEMIALRMLRTLEKENHITTTHLHEIKFWQK